MPPGYQLLKLDFMNAFNCLRRDKILSAVKDSAPELFKFVFSAYSSPSELYCGDHVIQSAEGVQQGDPLGPLLFCLTIHPLVLKLTSDFKVFYLDDGTLGGPFQDVLNDLKLVEEEAASLGLHLNRSKSELVCDDADICDAMLREAPGLRVVSCSQATLLGSPVGSTECVDSAIQSKVEVLRLMGERLGNLTSHDALLLLRHSFAIPKTRFVLRTAPCFLSDQLEGFDDLLRSVLSTILNIDLGLDTAWLQATLPVRAGGIGIRRAVQLAPSAYLASAAGCSELVSQILPSYLLETPDPNINPALSIWSQDHADPPPTAPSSSRQRIWDAPKIEATVNIILVNASDQQASARLKAVTTSESGAWLQAVPISSLGLRMDDETIRVAVGLRLGLPLCRPHMCTSCGAEVDKLGTHGLSCRFSKGRHSRHAAINDSIK